MVDVTDDKINIDNQNQSNTTNKLRYIFNLRHITWVKRISMMVFIGLISVTIYI